MKGLAHETRDKARHMLAFSIDYISMRLAGKGPGSDATLFSLIGVTRTSKVQLHRRTAKIFIDVIAKTALCMWAKLSPTHIKFHGKRSSCTHAAADTKTVINSVQLRYQPIINISN